MVCRASAPLALTTLLELASRILSGVSHKVSQNTDPQVRAEEVKEAPPKEPTQGIDYEQ